MGFNSGFKGLNRKASLLNTFFLIYMAPDKHYIAIRPSKFTLIFTCKQKIFQQV